MDTLSSVLSDIAVFMDQAKVVPSLLCSVSTIVAVLTCTAIIGKKDILATLDDNSIRTPHITFSSSIAYFALGGVACYFTVQLLWASYMGISYASFPIVITMLSVSITLVLATMQTIAAPRQRPRLFMSSYLLGFACGCVILFMRKPGAHSANEVALSLLAFAITAMAFGLLTKALAERPKKARPTLPKPLDKIRELCSLKKGVETQTSSPLTTLVLIVSMVFASSLCFVFANSYTSRIHRFPGTSQILQAIPLGDKVTADDLVEYDFALRPTRIVLLSNDKVQASVLIKYDTMSVTALFDDLNEGERWLITRAQTSTGFEDACHTLDGKAHQCLKYDDEGRLFEQHDYNKHGVLESVHIYEYSDDGVRSDICLTPEEYSSSRSING